jgi:predicted permease
MFDGIAHLIISALLALSTEQVYKYLEHLNLNLVTPALVLMTISKLIIDEKSRKV